MDMKRVKDTRRHQIHTAMRLHKTLKDCYVAGKSNEYTYIVKRYNSVMRQLNKKAA